tara:strand:- start:396 stop:680 length:285 start_codon:yes stop_codon:yes gene_type:complete
MITPDHVTMQADKNTFITLAPGAIGISGKTLGIQVAPENISKGILFKENMGFMQMIPSTIPTCIPNCMINIPGAGLVGAIAPGIAACGMMTAFG